jgi:AbrB family looped-hinge helix DNA binding protein
MNHTLAIVSTKGQLAIPKSVRDQLNIQEGTQVELTVDGDELRIRKANTWQELRGMLAESEVNATEASLEERRLDRARER